MPVTLEKHPDIGHQDCRTQGCICENRATLSCPGFSVVRTHASVSGRGGGAFGRFEILANASNRYDLGIIENLCIQRFMPSLNRMTLACELHLFKD